ncbi:hypothetical protein J7M28_04205 [bacterium]|nr:hypothetical protein [bacterium]
MEDCFLDKVDIDMSHVGWFDANMCAPFGAVLHRARQALNAISIVNVRDDVEKILCKNGLLRDYGHILVLDTYGTTVPYKSFQPSDLRYFNHYIKKYLRGKGIPTMTQALRKKFYEGIMEIFTNAATHSETKMGIHACGQFFPKKNSLDFSIADLGRASARTYYGVWTLICRLGKPFNGRSPSETRQEQGPFRVDQD